MKRTQTAAIALAVGLASVATPAAKADTASDIAQIRNEMKSLRGDYEKKIEDLEERLKRAEARATEAEAKAATGTTPVAEAAAPPPAPVVSAPSSASAFNPAISAILNGSYNVSSKDPSTLRIPGFVLGDEAGLRDRGFSLGESEVAITANVDQAFMANLIVALGSDNSIGVEEAFIRTTDLPAGFTVKAGRFFSGIGYLNERHAHVWDFSDAPLPYRAMLGNQYGDDGVQVRWLAPTDFFLEFGAEWMRGDAFPAGNADDNGSGTVSAFVHSGGDIDESSSFLLGASYLRTKSGQRDTGEIFSGKDDLFIASAVYKWAPNGNPLQTNLSVSGEYFLGNEQGNFAGVPVDYQRSGYYVLGVYQFMPRWRVGVRYAELQSDDAPLALAGTSLDNFEHTPQAISALLEYRTSEFGRIRVEYTLDDADTQSNDEFVFSYTVAIGAHGAHSF